MPADEPFDFAFIDADKVGYPDYYEETLRLLAARRPGDARQRASRRAGDRRRVDDEGDRAVLALNERIVADERVEMAMLGVSDGITLVLKRPVDDPGAGHG